MIHRYAILSGSFKSFLLLPLSFTQNHRFSVHLDCPPMVLLLQAYLILEVHVNLYMFCAGTCTNVEVYVSGFVSYYLIYSCCKHPLQEEVAKAERAIHLMGASLFQTCFGM